MGDEPGVTRNLQTILIDSHVKLIDSPGVVLPTENKTKASVISKVLLNAQHAGSVDNSRTAAIEILRRVDDYESLALHYRLELPDPAKNSPDYFLAVLARRKGWLKKGAVPDINAACRFLLKQWTSGDLQFHTMPPKLRFEFELKLGVTVTSKILVTTAHFPTPPFTRSRRLRQRNGLQQRRCQNQVCLWPRTRRRNVIKQRF